MNHHKNYDLYVEEPKLKDEGKALTHDDGKSALAHLPWAGVAEMAQVQGYGAKKYGQFYNYRKGMEVGRNISCAMRHMAAFMEGEDLDPESRRHHLAHAAIRLLYILQNIHDGRAIDDRNPYGGNGPAPLGVAPMPLRKEEV